jgi:hypothetical protein
MMVSILHQIHYMHTLTSLTARPPQQPAPVKRQAFRLPNQKFWVEIDSLMHHMLALISQYYVQVVIQFRPIFNKSLKPLVIRSAQRSPFRSSKALVATVVPIRMLSTVVYSKVIKALSRH